MEKILERVQKERKGVLGASPMRRVLNYFDNTEIMSRMTIFVFFALIIVFFRRTVTIPYGLMEDDGYFYAQIAYNIGLNRRSSFDGINITDGYHLLWCWILSGITFFVSFFTINKNIHIFFHIFFQLLIISYAALRVSKKNVFESFALFSFFLFGNLLMETVLLAVFLLLIASEEKSKLRYLVFFMVPLTRIDAAVILFPVLAHCLFTERKEFLKILLALTTGVLVHFISIYYLSGEFFTVSSILKTGKSMNITNNIVANITVNTRAFFRAATVFFSLFSALAVSFSRKKMNNSFLIVLGLLIFYFAHLGLGTMRSWYFVPGVVVGFVVFCRYRKNIIVHNVIFYLIVFLAFFHTSARIWVYVSLNEESKQANIFIEEIKRNVPENEPVFQYDASGFTGYFSERKIINGDGLVNTHSYARMLVDRKLGGYLEENDICYIIDNYKLSDRPIVDIGGLVVKKDELELIFGERDKCPYPMTCFSLYKIKTNRCRER